MRFIRHIILLILTTQVSPIWTQISSENIDEQSLDLLEFNSKNHEFSPAFVEEGIAYVSFKQKNKKDKPNRGERTFDIMLVSEENEPAIFSKEINGDFVEGPFSIHEEKIYLTRSNVTKRSKRVSQDNSLKMKVFMSEYNGTEWNEPEVIIFPSGDFNYCHPSVNGDGTVMILASDMTGGFGKMDLYISYYRDEAWSRPQNLGPEINTTGNDWFPFFNNDQHLFFASDGWSQNGDLDIYQVPYDNNMFKGVIKLPEPINGPYDDFGLVLDASGENILFSSSRPGKGKDDIYSISLKETINKELTPKTFPFSIQLIDEITEEVLPKKEIQIVPINLADFNLEEYDESIILNKIREVNTMSFNIKTDMDGSQLFNVDSQTKYALLIKIPGYKESRFLYDPSMGNHEWIISMTPLGIKKIEEKKIVTAPPKKETKKIIIPTTKGSKVIFENIYYEYNSAIIKDDQAKELDALFKALKENPNMRIQLIAHSDSRGKDDYNLKLSEQRALSAKAYLIKRGISDSRIESKGLGEAQIRNHCLNGVSCSDIEHRFNRRTEVRILDI